jgi:hypothetical protein
VQECVPFRRAMGKETNVGDSRSKDGTDNGGGARAGGSGRRV